MVSHSIKKFIFSFSVPALLIQSPSYAKSVFRGPASAGNQEISDVVEKVRQDDEGITVLFKKSPGSYYLQHNSKDFDKARKKLEQSLKAKKPVKVMVESQELNILEVK